MTPSRIPNVSEIAEASRIKFGRRNIGSIFNHKDLPVSAPESVSIAPPTDGGGVVVPPIPLDPSVTGLTLANTAKTRAGMSRVRSASGGMKIVTVGDSTTGTGNLASGNSRLLAWPGVMSDRLLSDGGLASNKQNGFGFCGKIDQPDYNAYFPQLQLSGGFAASATNTAGGFIFGSAGSGAMTFSPLGACNKFRIVYSKSTAVGTFSWKIDGGTPTNVNRQIGAGFERGEIIIDANNSPALGTLGSHVLTISWVTGFVGIVGIEAMVADGKYVRVLNFGWAQSTSGNWNDAAYPYSPLPMITSEQADLVIVNLGINNWRSADVTAQYSTDIQAVINAAKTGGSEVILMHPMPSASSSAEMVSLARQAGYRNAINALATSNNLPIISLNTFYGSGDAAIAAGDLLPDGVHQTASPVGYAKTGKLVADTLRYIERMAA